MALTTYITYEDATGKIVTSNYLDDGEPAPTPPANHSVHNTGEQTAPLPLPETHKIDLGPPVAVVAKTQQEIDDEKNAILKLEYREAIATMEGCKDKYLLEAPPWDTAPLQIKIDELRTLHDALP